VQKTLRFHLVVILVAAPGVGEARADLYSAGQAYEKQDFETAFRLYRELAELGQVFAQEIVAAMYVEGTGVKRDNVLGYAWASIALENGAGDQTRNIVTQLDPHMTANARKRVEEVKAQFGRDASSKALLPNIFENANYLLRGEPSVEDVAKARTWLERAVANQNHDAKFYLAALLAAGADPGSRDPQRSLVMLKEVMSEMDADPTAFEIRAAAQAMLGNFVEAQKDQQKALRMVRKLGWETASQQTRLTTYEKRAAWSGDLFAF
jgi:TPR repeat protein